jgi:hypothetical protein
VKINVKKEIKEVIVTFDKHFIKPQPGIEIPAVSSLLIKQSKRRAVLPENGKTSILEESFFFSYF